MGENQLLNRKVYKDIKKFDRQQMENFFRETYEEGFHKGFRAGADAGKKAVFKIQLVQLLEGMRGNGIGPKTVEKILQAYKERKSNENESDL